MLRDDAVSLIQEYLGFRTDQQTTIITRLQQAQRLLETGRSLPYFLIQEDQPLSILATVQTVALPVGFIREADEQGPHYIGVPFDEFDFEEDLPGPPTEMIFIEKLTYENAITRFTGVDPGEPEAYVLRASTLQIWPVPDINYTLTWSYYAHDAILASNITNQWLTLMPDALIGRAGMLAAQALRNKDAMALFQDMYQQGWASMLGDTIMREEAGNPIIMGSRLP